MTVKEQLRQVLETLPEDAGIEEAMERLYLLYRIQRGSEQLDAGQGVPHEAARKQLMDKWGR